TIGRRSAATTLRHLVGDDERLAVVAGQERIGVRVVDEPLGLAVEVELPAGPQVLAVELDPAVLEVFGHAAERLGAELVTGEFAGLRVFARPLAEAVVVVAEVAEAGGNVPDLDLRVELAGVAAADAVDEVGEVVAAALHVARHLRPRFAAALALRVELPA